MVSDFQDLNEVRTDESVAFSLRSPPISLADAMHGYEKTYNETSPEEVGERHETLTDLKGNQFFQDAYVHYYNPDTEVQTTPKIETNLDSRRQGQDGGWRYPWKVSKFIWHCHCCSKLTRCQSFPKQNSLSSNKLLHNSSPRYSIKTFWSLISTAKMRRKPRHLNPDLCTDDTASVFSGINQNEYQRSGKLHIAAQLCGFPFRD